MALSTLTENSLRGCIPDNTAAADVIAVLEGAFTDVVTTPGITGTDSSLGVAGQAAAQGGAVAIVGGVSSTSTNAGGAVSMIGAIGTTTAVGGEALVRGGAGTGAAVGGAAKVEGGLGGSSTTVGVGGAATITAGAGQATAAGGIASLVGGASGAGATGNGGAVAVTAGAAASTNGQGGKITLQPGAGTGTGFGGELVLDSTSRMVKQAAATAKTTSATLTVAEMKVGIITVNQGASGTSVLTLPTGTDFEAGFSAFQTDFAWDFHVVNISTVAAEIVQIATATGWTLVGGMFLNINSASVGAISSGHFRAHRTAANTFTLYRLA